MTALSAPSANGTPSTANPSAASPTASAALAHVRIPGSARTYEVRDVLRGMGLRWDPVSHAWHGALTADRGEPLQRRYGLRPQVVPAIESFSTDRATSHAAARPIPPAGPRHPTHPGVAHDGSRTRAEARVAYHDGSGAEDAEEIATPTRRFSVFEITGGMPDDSREEDERAEERRLRELRTRVKAARAAISATPGAEEILRQDWIKGARFYASFGITEKQFRQGVRESARDDADNPG